MAGEYQRPDGEFPCHGARARIFARFEREFEEWLETPEGRFAVWEAREHRLARRPVRAAMTARAASSSAPARRSPVLHFRGGTAHRDHR